MGASKDKKGKPALHVASLTEAMGLGNRIKTGDPAAPTTVRHVAGQHAGGGGASSKGSAKEFKTIHKGKGWDGPPVRKNMTSKYSPKKGD